MSGKKEFEALQKLARRGIVIEIGFKIQLQNEQRKWES